MDAPDRGDAIGRRGQLRNNLCIVRRPALQRQQADDHLQAVQQPMVGLLPQHRLLFDQLVLLTKQGFFPGESLAKPAFRAPVFHQLAFVARDRATLAVFKNAIQGTFPLRRLFDGHLVASLYVQFAPGRSDKNHLRPRAAKSH